MKTLVGAREIERTTCIRAWTVAMPVVLTALLAVSASQSATAAPPASDMPVFEQALILATRDNTKPAHKILDRLLESKTTDVPRDRLLLTKGRLLYQDGDVKGSLAYFEKVPSDSDYWLISIEERGWAHLRLGEHGPALAQLKTLKAPMFSSLIGPEPYFLEGLVHLRVCDYSAVFETIKSFKAGYRERLTEIQNLAKTGTSAAASSVLGKLRKEPLVWKTVAPEASKLPRLFHRDRQFVRSIEDLKAGRTDTTAAQRRLKQLAERDVKEIGEILQKMHLLEAEVIQRIHIAEKPNGRPNRDVEIAKGEEVLVFKDTDEFWLDELDNYQVNVKGCPTATGGQKL